MASLSTHLTAGTDKHGRLRFHPECPRCTRERIAGTLAEDALVSRRTQAALAAGLLAFSTAAPAAAAAAPPVEGDQEQEGLTAPGADEPGVEPDFDPGGEDGFETDTGPEGGSPEGGGAEDSGEGAPLDHEPPQDSEAPRVEEPAPAPPGSEPSPANPPAAPAPAPAAPTPAPPPVAVPPAQPPVQELVDPEGPAAAHSDRRRQRLVFTIPTQRAPQQPTYQPSADTTLSAVDAEAPPAAAASAAQDETITVAKHTERSGSGGVRYVVRPGDSLWSIAKRELGPGASSGQVARLVSRLWQLNRERIATGDPDLLRVGTELRLP